MGRWVDTLFFHYDRLIEFHSSFRLFTVEKAAPCAAAAAAATGGSDERPAAAAANKSNKKRGGGWTVFITPTRLH